MEDNGTLDYQSIEIGGISFPEHEEIVSIFNEFEREPLKENGKNILEEIETEPVLL